MDTRYALVCWECAYKYKLCRWWIECFFVAMLLGHKNHLESGADIGWGGRMREKVPQMRISENPRKLLLMPATSSEKWRGKEQSRIKNKRCKVVHISWYQKRKEFLQRKIDDFFLFQVEFNTTLPFSSVRQSYYLFEGCFLLQIVVANQSDKEPNKTNLLLLESELWEKWRSEPLHNILVSCALPRSRWYHSR